MSQPPGLTVTRTLNLREGPSAKHRVIDKLAAGEPLDLVRDEGDWLLVRHGQSEGYVSSRYVKAHDSGSTRQSEAPQPDARAKDNGGPRPRKPLRKGQRGAQVRRLQQALDAYGFAVQADGIFGPGTERALRRFQKKQEISPTGEADARTLAALWGEPPPPMEEPEAEGGGLATARHTVSDQPVRGVEDDRLGFKSSVYAMVEFLRAEETQPPLALGVCASWGRGKTSFMRMMESELSRAGSDRLRFARVWFNPWMYDDEKQVWAALLAAITTRIRGALGWRRRIEFELKRFWRNALNRVGLGLLLRLALILFAGGLFIWFLFDPALQALSRELLLGILGDTGKTVMQSSWIGDWLPALAAAYLAYQVYDKVIKKFNQGLLAHLRETRFRDKIGTLAEFEDEMALLNNCIPANLKVVVFVDDLDRCKPAILSELIEALQLLEVSRMCIYVLGMDLRVVARTVGSEYAALNPEVDSLTVLERDEMSALQHGRGYLFLEKIIQARISVPAYSEARMAGFAADLGHGAPEPGTSGPAGEPPPVEAQKDAAPGQQPSDDATPEIPRDSAQVVDAIAHYGGRYFRNPRRFKRWLNSFRMQAYLARATGFPTSVDRLARFLVLSEKWPGLIAWLRRHPDLMERLMERGWDRHQADLNNRFGTDPTWLVIQEALREDSVRELLQGSTKHGPIDPQWLVRACDWYGFQYYP